VTGLRVINLDNAGLPALADALFAAGLPNSDIGDAGRLFFRFENELGIAGYGGLEGGNADRLMRSVVVPPGRQGCGMGRAIVADIEREAAAMGAERLHLLTTTAAAFFSGIGYQVADRTSAPAIIAASAEFTSLCPASAVYMIKTLEI